VDLGVDVNAANTDGRTALDAAKNLGYDMVAKFLIEKGGRSKSDKAVSDKSAPRKQETETEQ
jgi:ankyrin repeat protein